VLSLLRMSVHAVISSTGHRRIHCAQRWLENRAAAEEVLIVGATLDAANELARKVAKKKGAAFGWRRLILPQLAFVIAAPILAARGLTPLSRIGAAALVARLVYRMNAEGRLSHYRSVATTPGFPRAVAGVIMELRLARISLEAIGASAPDLKSLVEAYENELKEAGLTDWPGVLALACEAASAVGGNRPRLIGLPMLLLDLPIRNEAEFVFVESLTAATTDVLATAPTADQATLRRLRDRLRAQIEDLDLRSPGDEIGASATSASALTNLQRRIFKEEERPIEAKPDDTVEVFSAPGEGRECVEIARRVLSVARDGVPFTGSLCCSGHRTDTAPTSRRLSTGRAFRLILRMGRFGPIPPDAPSVRFSSARPMACPRGDSRSTFRSDRFRMRRPMARLPKRFPAANAGYPPIPSLLNPRLRKALKSSNPHSPKRAKPMKLQYGKDS
jgi:ATP-dependent helicase/nuclease subunit B